MDLRQLEIFLAVMECSSVTRTAEKLYLSPGAVSLQLHNLAAELRTDLFVRAGRHIVPTEQARRLAAGLRERSRQRLAAIPFRNGRHHPDPPPRAAAAASSQEIP